ncbi:MAG TPA: hypothetical protein VK624_04495 [Steroidobacteraceae bacterium]|nr:hypothetical protein [Steroidobacteraceae bacterium]
MNRSRAFLLVALVAFTTPATAHDAPNSFVRFDFRAHSVWAELMIPQSELVYAMNGAPTAGALPAYLLKHVGAATPQGEAFRVRVTAVRATTYLAQPYFVAELELVPPAGGSARDFLFTNDAITHEVRNHVVFVVAKRDYADAALEAQPGFLGALQYPARQLAIRRPDEASFAPARRQARGRGR